jgi:hypothetical protein
MKAKHRIGILISAGLALWLVFGMTIVAANHPFTPGSLLFPNRNSGRTGVPRADLR